MFRVRYNQIPNRVVWVCCVGWGIINRCIDRFQDRFYHLHNRCRFDFHRCRCCCCNNRSDWLWGWREGSGFVNGLGNI